VATLPDVDKAIPRPPPPVPPLSPARGELAAAIARVDEARRECEIAAGPANRLQQVIHQLAAAENELVALRSVDERALAEWLAAGATNERPQPSVATLEAEKRLAQLTRDGSAARSALPMVETIHKACAEKLTLLGEQREASAYHAAVEAAREFLGEYSDALITALKFENRLRSLENAMRIAGHNNPRSTASSTAFSCASQIGEAIVAARREAAVEHDFQTGTAFLNRLMADPEATL
jgi:hypothetical protein